MAARPIIRVLDLETTGGDPPEHGVVEAAWFDLESHQVDLLAEPSDWRMDDSKYFHSLVSPRRSIPPEAKAVHHIIEDDLVDALSWQHASEHFIGADYYAAHSIKDDRKFVTDEMTGGKPWICTYKAALRLFPDAPRHSLQVLRYYVPMPGLARVRAWPPHRAQSDAYVCAHLLLAMLDLAPVADLIEWSSKPSLLTTCYVGKDWRGHKWADVDIGFLRWISERDFDEDTLFTVRHWIAKHEEEWERERAERRAQLTDAERPPVDDGWPRYD